MEETDFQWDINKEVANVLKHGVSFEMAQRAFVDPKRVIAQDDSHSGRETRYYCYGMVERGVLTVRFTVRGGKVSRIFGAGYWRKGRKFYEKANQIHG